MHDVLTHLQGVNSFVRFVSDKEDLSEAPYLQQIYQGRLRLNTVNTVRFVRYVANIHSYCKYSFSVRTVKNNNHGSEIKESEY